MKPIQLYFLHFAGGNCYSFDFLINELKKHRSQFEYLPLELPGRGNRLDESLLTSKEEAIEDYLQQIVRKRNNAPYMIIGHSMGAALGLSVVKGLEDKNDPPFCFLATGTPGPGLHSRKDEQPVFVLSDEDFKAELRKLGGVPEEILDNKDLYDFFSPIIRSDFQLLEENKGFENGLKIKTSIHALMGDEEPLVDKIKNWEKFTFGTVETQILRGNHFFIHRNKGKLSSVIRQHAATYKYKHIKKYN
ncbi:thioesterase II family protein [Salegentibacter sp. UBA1130]|uniref:thioesterase II family protein n=1 Tax=Salegentibacter sp. UBA1130 TaxID=1947451 RepID=UPI0025798C7B|nr:alpha/beta fold hydrolase [Salegentibacter sp. UBA1130]